MLLSLLVGIAVIGVIVLLAAGLGIAAIAISGREDRKTVIIIVLASGLALFCCLAAVGSAIGWYLYGMPK